jgi:hypothetical protein
MDADHLEPERVRACSFMLMTAEGPISMCEHNAHRDEFVLKPIAFRRRDGSLANYDPLSKPVNRQQQTVSSVEAREC